MMTELWNILQPRNFFSSLCLSTPSRLFMTLLSQVYKNIQAECFYWFFFLFPCQSKFSLGIAVAGNPVDLGDHAALTRCLSLLQKAF